MLLFTSFLLLAASALDGHTTNKTVDIVEEIIQDLATSTRHILVISRLAKRFIMIVGARQDGNHSEDAYVFDQPPETVQGTHIYLQQPVSLASKWPSHHWQSDIRLVIFSDVTGLYLMNVHRRGQNGINLKTGATVTLNKRLTFLPSPIEFYNYTFISTTDMVSMYAFYPKLPGRLRYWVGDNPTFNLVTGFSTTYYYICNGPQGKVYIHVFDDGYHTPCSVPSWDLRTGYIDDEDILLFNENNFVYRLPKYAITILDNPVEYTKSASSDFFVKWSPEMVLTTRANNRSTTLEPFIGMAFFIWPFVAFLIVALLITIGVCCCSKSSSTITTWKKSKRRKSKSGARKPRPEVNLMDKKTKTKKRSRAVSGRSQKKPKSENGEPNKDANHVSVGHSQVVSRSAENPPAKKSKTAKKKQSKKRSAMSSKSGTVRKAQAGHSKRASKKGSKSKSSSDLQSAAKSTVKSTSRSASKSAISKKTKQSKKRSTKANSKSFSAATKKRLEVKNRYSTRRSQSASENGSKSASKSGLQSVAQSALKSDSRNVSKSDN